MKKLVNTAVQQVVYAYHEVVSLIRHINSHWEWRLAIVTAASVTFMLVHVSSASMVYIFTFMFAVVPPFMFVPYGLFVLMGGRHFRVYAHIVGWAMYVAFVGLLIGAKDLPTDPYPATLYDVYTKFFGGMTPEKALSFMVMEFIVIVAPIALFFMTKSERENPIAHRWDITSTK